MDNENEKNTVSAENTAEAEIKESAAADIGKFKSVDALYSAYQALEAEFTRRNQRLKELEKANKAQENVRTAPSPEEDTIKPLDESVRQAVIEDYLKSVASNGVPVLSGGVSPVTPRLTVKSLKEAGALAQNFLKN